MSQKKVTTRRSKEGGGETKTAPAPLALGETFARDVEMYCRLLERDDTPEVFKDAFGAVVTDALFNGSRVSLLTPAVLRVALPLVLDEWGESKNAGVAVVTMQTLTVLREVLAGKVGEAARAELFDAEKGGAR